MIKKIIHSSLSIIVTFLLFGFMLTAESCKDTGTIQKGESTYSAVFSETNDAWVQKELSGMTLEEKAAQVVFPKIGGYYTSRDAVQFQKALDEVKDLKVGGIILGLGDVYESAAVINELQKNAKVPLLICSDFERGVAHRIDGTTAFPYNMGLGAADDSTLTYKMGSIIAEEGQALGVHQNYAPVSDVNTDPDNPIINVRSFGDNVNLVKKLSTAIIKGIQHGGMIATAKHFPGHGNTNVDSHRSLAVIHSSKEELNNTDLPPFESDIKDGVMSVMVGHLDVPALESQNLPATLSHNIVTGLLKNKLGFNGLVVTDAMEMHAITNSYNTDDAAIKALNAGNDVILLPSSAKEAIHAIVYGVKKGIISKSRLDDAVTKVLIAKKWAGLDKNNQVDLSKIPEKVGTNSHWEVANKLARKSITLVKDENNLIPLSGNAETKYTSISILDNDQAGVESLFNRTLSKETNNLTLRTVLENSDKEVYQSAVEAAKRADVVLLSIYTRVRAYSGKLGLNESQHKLVKEILRSNKNVILLSHGNPYILSEFPEAKTYLCNYGDINVSEIALANALFGEIPVEGKLPVTIPNTNAKFGTGITLAQTALRPVSRFKLADENKKFKGVDSVVNAAIQDSAFPGAELLVAQNGVILHFKSFGHYTYDDTSGAISKNTMYDLASLTKVTATTTATMMCYDKGLFKLDDKVAKYLPQFGRNGKENVTIRNLLVHDSGLRPDVNYHDFIHLKDPKPAIYSAIDNDSLVYPTGTKMVYSDLNFITMGRIIEKVTGESLDKFTENHIFKPLGMSSTMFTPPKSLVYRIAPTEHDTTWRHRQIRGTVHDETSALLGGVAGHAGLFSDASDLSKLLQMLLQKGTYQGRRFIKASTVEMFTKKQSDLSTRALGWDTKTPNPGYSSAGHLFSNLSYGHTGFTGTSLWTDPTRKLFVVFLTNRVYPTRNNHKIGKVRPEVHDVVIRALEK